MYIEFRKLHQFNKVDIHLLSHVVKFALTNQNQNNFSVLDVDNVEHNKVNLIVIGMSD